MIIYYFFKGLFKTIFFKIYHILAYVLSKKYRKLCKDVKRKELSRRAHKKRIDTQRKQRVSKLKPAPRKKRK